MSLTETRNEICGKFDRYFNITERGSSVSRELRAGVTTWLAMAYIVFVNPSILSNVITIDDATAQLVTVTAVAAVFGTLLMGLWANLPYALAPGWGQRILHVQRRPRARDGVGVCSRSGIHLGHPAPDHFLDRAAQVHPRCDSVVSEVHNHGRYRHVSGDHRVCWRRSESGKPGDVRHAW